MFYFIDTYTEEELQQRYAQAARLIDEADSLIIAAGAGMGVDSGLPDFRDTQGFWQAYPALGKSGIRFERIASPDRGARRHARHPAGADGLGMDVPRRG